MSNVIDAYLTRTGQTSWAWSKKVGVSQTTVIRWRRGEAEPTFANIKRMVEASDGGLAVEDFLNGE